MKQGLTIVALGILLVIQPSSAQQKETGFEKDTFTGSSGKALRYALFQPDQANADSTLPLVLSLHGVGSRGKENWAMHGPGHRLSRPEMQEKFPCYILAPTCDPPREIWWEAKNIRAEPRLPDVLELLEKLLEELSVDRQCIYVTGLSMGGFGTFGAIGQRPDLFAAAVPVCGGSDPKIAKDFAHVPIWIFHGEKDRSVPVEWSREMVEALAKAGGKPKYTEYPGAGHGVWGMAYKTEELWEWMFAQRREEATPAKP